MTAATGPITNWNALRDFTSKRRLASTRTDDEADRVADLECDWRRWTRALFPKYFGHTPVERHEQFWDWAWQIEAGVRPAPFVAIWPRGGAKSTTAEVATVAMGARRRRRYALYVSGTQPQADKHVQNIGRLLESNAFADMYPGMGSRGVNKYGASKGWRRNQLQTASGFVVDAIGLDVAARGFKVDDARPDVIFLDDIDARHDSPAVVQKKVEAITESILPTGSHDCAIGFVQNRVHGRSIASSFIDGTNTFLIDHFLSGPFPAVEDLIPEQRTMPDGRRQYFIIGGRATWAGQSLQTCEKQINDWGLDAFRAEAQHEKRERPGGMFSHLDYAMIEPRDLPDMVTSSVWCDPAVSNTDDSDCYAIEGDSIDYNGIIYRRYSWEGKGNPEDVVKRAILIAIQIESPTVGIETDQGGDTWQSVYWRAVEALQREHAGALPYVPRFRAAKAGSFGSKAHRASQMLLDYERAEIRHVRGTHQALERALYRFPKVKPFDLVDASFWSWADLRGMVPDEDSEGPGLLLTGSSAGWFVVNH